MQHLEQSTSEDDIRYFNVKADHKKIKDWMRSHPRVTCDINRTLEQIYNLVDDEGEQELIENWFDHAEHWLHFFPRRKITNNSWASSFFDGSRLDWLTSGKLTPEEQAQLIIGSDGKPWYDHRVGWQALKRLAPSAFAEFDPATTTVKQAVEIVRRFLSTPEGQQHLLKFRPSNHNPKAN